MTASAFSDEHTVARADICHVSVQGTALLVFIFAVCKSSQLRVSLGGCLLVSRRTQG